jgi:hypothetical protein
LTIAPAIGALVELSVTVPVIVPGGASATFSVAVDPPATDCVREIVA